MNELGAYQHGNLPVQPADLARFILLVPEKVKAMQAEIRAIQKAQLAKEVYDQKKSELDRLRELMLLAYQRMGEITREMPTAQGVRRDLELLPSSGKKSKGQVIENLGLSTSQVGRMEQIAAHPDIVEKVIAESQAGQTEATQGEVLRRIKEQENRVIDLDEVRESKFQTDMEQIDRDYDNLRYFKETIKFTELYEITNDILDSVAAVDADLNWTLDELETVIQMLMGIKQKLIERKMKNGKAYLHAGDQGLHL